MRINTIVVHCSDSPHGRGDRAETIHEWHLRRGWHGIGYHYVITEHGIVDRGRPEYWKGSHVKGHNKNSLGICLIGRDQFSPQQYAVLADLIRELQQRHPGAQVVGHYQLDPGKTCPNFDVPGFLSEWGI